jgi:hypothetical protein
MHIDPQLYEIARVRQEERLQRSLAAYAARSPSVQEQAVRADRARHVRLLARLLRHETEAPHAPARTQF